MKTGLPFTILLLVCCVSAGTARAQALTTDTTNYTIAVQHAIEAYHQYLTPHTGLYNGSEYVEYAYTINEGIPFFETTQFSTGLVDYDSMQYSNVPLLYDEVLGKLIINDFYGRGKIALHTEKVASFSLLNHRFKKLLPDTTGNSAIRPGFYEVLYEGNVSVYKKQTKKVLETITNFSVINRAINEQNNYYLQKGARFYKVNSKKDALNITKDKKREVQQFIKKNKLNVRKQPDAALVQIAAYYQQLTNP